MTLLHHSWEIERLDTGKFDRLVRSWSSFGSHRRTLLALLATLPFLGGLTGLPGLEDEVEGHGRRKRRKKRHKHGKGRSKGKRKKQRCKSHPLARTCQGKCGLVKNNCKKTVDCGACTCDPSCSGSCCAGVCVDLDTDPNNCGACGEACPAGQVCQVGECGIACGGAMCDPASEICVDDMCQACDVTCNSADHTCSGTDLQTALDGGDTVYVCPGRYIGGFTLDVHVTVIGAGQGGDERVDTILDGLAADRVLSVANAVTASLERLRIAGGAFPGLGAGVYNNGDLTLTACTVTANTATDGRGGGLFNGGFGSSLTMNDCTVSKNTTAGTVGSRHGGGIAGSFGGTVTLTGCTISGNISSAGGGGIHNDGTLILDDCTIDKNRAEGGDGGGIRNIGGAVTLTGGSVEDNFASGDGGGLYTSSGTVDITGTSFQDNDPDNCAGPGTVTGTCN
jgi:hypothetical protein